MEKKQYVVGRLIFDDDSWELFSSLTHTRGSGQTCQSCPWVLDEEGMGPINSDERDNKTRSYIKQRASEASSGVFLPSLWFSTYFLILVGHVISTRSNETYPLHAQLPGETNQLRFEAAIQPTLRIY